MKISLKLCVFDFQWWVLLQKNPWPNPFWKKFNNSKKIVSYHEITQKSTTTENYYALFLYRSSLLARLVIHSELLSIPFVFSRSKPDWTLIWPKFPWHHFKHIRNNFQELVHQFVSMELIGLMKNAIRTLKIKFYSKSFHFQF